LLFLIEGDNVCEKTFDIKGWTILGRFGHGEKLNVDSKGSKIVCSLLSHSFVSLRPWVVLIGEEKYALVVTLLLNTLKLLVTNPKGFKERYVLTLFGKAEIFSES